MSSTKNNDTQKAVLSPSKLYLGDNGACFCGKCAGASAKYTGRDISGQPVYKMTKRDLAEYTDIACEGCGATGR